MQIPPAPLLSVLKFAPQGQEDSVKKINWRIVSDLVMLCGTVWILGDCLFNNTTPPAWFSYVAIVLAFILSPLYRLIPPASAVTHEIVSDDESEAELADGTRSHQRVVVERTTSGG